MNTTTYSFMPAPLQHSAAGSNDAEFGTTKLAPNSSTRFRTAIITGGNSGLGYACAGALLTEGSSAQPWKIVIACRDMTRAYEAVERLRKQAAAAVRRDK